MTSLTNENKGARIAVVDVEKFGVKEHILLTLTYADGEKQYFSDVDVDNIGVGEYLVTFKKHFKASLLRRFFAFIKGFCSRGEKL